MSRAADRTAARREARVRRAELRLFATSRRYADALEDAAADPMAPAQASSSLALADLEAAALNYAEIAPAARRRRRRRA